MDPTGILEAGRGNTPSGMMIEVLPEIAEVTGPTSDSISWKIEEDSEESAVDRRG